MHLFTPVRTGVILILTIAISLLTYSLFSQPEITPISKAATQLTAERAAAINAVSRNKERDSSAVDRINFTSSQDRTQRLVSQAGEQLTALQDAQSAARAAARAEARAAEREARQEARESVAAEEQQVTSEVPSSGSSNGDLTASGLPEPWLTLAKCESGLNPTTNTGNGYSGLFQFSDSTWQSVGGSGSAYQASVEEQLMRAQTLQARSGWGQWPTCAAGF